MAVPISSPTGLRIEMVAPASPVPVTDRPSPPTVAVGASGAVMSGAVSATVGEALPAASLWPTTSVWRSTCGVASVTE